MDTCTFLQTHKALVNCIAVLVADVVLLLTMLIGLLRHAHRSSTGIWKLLYQQVRLKIFHLVSDSEFVLVHDLVRVGFDCRDTTYGRSLSVIGLYSAHYSAGPPYSESEWCDVFFCTPLLGRRLMTPSAT